MMDSLNPGTVFAGYLIEGVLGTGGMGTVYAARHPRLPRRDALKVLPANRGADAEFRARFIREAELAARLDHPNIIAVYDRGVTGDRLWIAMQFVDGADAAELVRRSGGGLPPYRAVHIVGEAARGLDEAHRAGMLHRDVKPANLLLRSRDGEPDRVWVTDFGIARAAGEATALTEVGSVMGTLAYAAPEQLMAGVVDHRADIYALGCTLYELLTGRKPYVRATVAAVMQAHLSDPPPRVTAVHPGFPPAIDEVIARALAKDPGRRYPSCGALASAAADAFGLAPAIPQPIEVSRPHPLDSAPPRTRGRRLAVAVGALAAVAAVAVASAVVLSANSSDGPTAAPTAAPTTKTSGPSATPADPVNWGNHTFVAKVFPGLLPASPGASGYQGMRCIAMDRDRKQVDLNVPLQGVGHLNCNGNRAPAEVVSVFCNVNRTPTRISPFPDVRVVGDQPWERLSGTGRIIWADTTNPAGQPAGVLEVAFDDVERNFCSIAIYGGSSGQDLYDRWWREAPV
ncbi:serine/threonine-protein kinase [Nocardia sp. NPDC052566]|uniref:serine/threonine-protein kinase n=1 Tax=Nocardia sp. NPDC052566 TaxID=3364330 RepID=UPI0037C76803